MIDALDVIDSIGYTIAYPYDYLFCWWLGWVVTCYNVALGDG